MLLFINRLINLTPNKLTPMEISTLSYFPTTQEKEDLKSKFRIWHIETLVNQSAQLLEDCLNDLKELYALKSQHFSHSQENQEVLSNIEVEEYYLMKFTGSDAIPKAIAAKYIEELSLNSNSVQDFNESENSTFPYNANPRVVEQTGGPLKDSNNPNYYYLQNRLQRNNLLLQKLETELKSLYKDEKDTKENKENERKKKIIEINKNKIKLREENSRYSKIFDYGLFIQLANQRLERNYQDLIERIVIIEQGLLTLYGVDEPIQESLNKKVPNGESIKYTLDDFNNGVIDDFSLIGKVQPLYAPMSPIQKTTEIYVWLYDKIKFLAAYAQLEQSFSFCFSLKERLSAAEFERMLSSTDVFETQLTLPIQNFPTSTHENIRFKGIGAYFIGSAGRFPWRLTIGFPDNAFYIRENQEFPVDQLQIPKCILGRVENANAQRNIEYCGLNSLLNASPLSMGKYSLKIEKPAVSYEAFAAIEDIVFEMNLNGKLL